MNVSQLHEQLRRELLRRIQRGALSGSLLARQTGLKPAHISNFLHRKRKLSLEALDRVLSAQMLNIEDLLHNVRDKKQLSGQEELSRSSKVPLVTQSAINEAGIRASSISELIQLPFSYLDHLSARRSPERRSWERFVAIRISHTQADAMMPAVKPHSMLVLDRHYTSLTPYRAPLPNIYAIHIGREIIVRYATLRGGNIVLRPARLEYPVELLEMKPGQSPSDFIIGRVCASISEL
ncbi:MAG TPA: helix-turn-helix domain-containing protein [Pseudacidobacterium sp.]|jgi:transcriptional regulator with XRE-family HTH domain|nr:helix-turn-helix domain-containing protein [Pseudacidobacterium sp.]